MDNKGKKDDYKERKKLFNVRQTIIELIKDRGYNLPDNINIDFTVFNIMYDNDNLSIEINDNDKLLYAYFDKGIKTFGKNNLKELVTKIREKNKDNSIKILVILKDKCNSTLKKEIQKSYYDDVEILLQSNFQFNITKNYLVPKHEKVPKEKHSEILEKYNCKYNQLPRIQHNDPISIYYGFKKGDICKITRNDFIAGNSIYYRYVI